MYIIAVYNIGEKRVGKMLKLFRRYLHWIQNSVFEGELSDVKLKELKIEAHKIMDTTTCCNEEEKTLFITAPCWN
jgi:CRISPR-associated protein Cas2